METVPDNDIVDQHGLTPAQLGLLYHVASEPGEHFFVERIVCPLYGELDVAAFIRAWRTLVARHASLRASFVYDDPRGPLQMIHRDAALDIQVVDWSMLTPDGQSARLEATLAEEVERDFDLRRPPLMRMTIAKLSPEESLLIWSSHHLILDGWSCWILLSEAALLYLADRHGVALSLPAAPSFIDYARWLAREDRSAERRAYWQAYFEGYRPRSAELTARPGKRRFRQDRASLSRATMNAIHVWRRRTGAALNTLLQAAWALTLAQDRDPDEVLFGSVFSGRSSAFPGAADVVGLMITVLPVRVPIRFDMPVSAWLNLIQQRHADMLLHESCSVQEVRRWVGFEQERPLFDSALVLMNVDPLDRLPPLGFRIGKPQYLANANYPLGVNVTPGAELTVEMLYDERYFTKDRVRELQAIFASAITAIIESGDERVGDLWRRLRAACRHSAAERRRSLAGHLNRKPADAGRTNSEKRDETK